MVSNKMHSAVCSLLLCSPTLSMEVSCMPPKTKLKTKMPRMELSCSEVLDRLLFFHKYASRAPAGQPRHFHSKRCAHQSSPSFLQRGHLADTPRRRGALRGALHVLPARYHFKISAPFPLTLQKLAKQESCCAGAHLSAQTCRCLLLQ